MHEMPPICKAEFLSPCQGFCFSLDPFISFLTFLGPLYIILVFDRLRPAISLERRPNKTFISDTGEPNNYFGVRRNLAFVSPKKKRSITGRHERCIMGMGVSLTPDCTIFFIIFLMHLDG